MQPAPREIERLRRSTALTLRRPVCRIKRPAYRGLQKPIVKLLAWCCRGWLAGDPANFPSILQENTMQIGIFSVGENYADPLTGKTPSESERIKAIVTAAIHADQAGLDVFAIGEHHNPPYVPSAPSTLLAYVAARTRNIILSTSTTLITTNDPVKIAEEFATLQHLAGDRVDLMMGRGNTPAVYPWFGMDISHAEAIGAENYALLRRLWREEKPELAGELQSWTRAVHFRSPAARR
jgi:hypothetical protein